MTTPTPAAPGALAAQAPGYVRTLVPIVLGPLIARYGFDADDPTTLMICSSVAGWLYYVIVRLIETKAPGFGYLLGIAKQPVYSTAASPSPGPNEDVVAVVVAEPPPSPTDSPVAPGVPVQTNNGPRPDVDTPLPVDLARDGDLVIESDFDLVDEYDPDLDESLLDPDGPPDSTEKI